MLELKFYPNGNLKDYISRNNLGTTEADKKRWALQMIESVYYLHSKGVRHGDLRLDQWLLDERNARLCDFEGSGFDAQPTLGLEMRSARGLECLSHWLPRPDEDDSSEKTDIFALGSSLYELMAGEKPFAGMDDDTIETRFRQGTFPDTTGLILGVEISKCWNQEFKNAGELLEMARNTFSAEQAPKG